MALFSAEQIRVMKWVWCLRGAGVGFFVGASLAIGLQHAKLDELAKIGNELQEYKRSAVAASHEARAGAYAKVLAHCLNGGMIETRFDTVICDRMEKKQFWSATQSGG